MSGLGWSVSGDTRASRSDSEAVLIRSVPLGAGIKLRESSVAGGAGGEGGSFWDSVAVAMTLASLSI